MQPLDADERAAIKRAHPELDAEEVDSLLDRLDELRFERTYLDRGVAEDSSRLQQIDDERAQLIEGKLPKLEQALQKAHGERKRGG